MAVPRSEPVSEAPGRCSPGAVGWDITRWRTLSGASELLGWQEQQVHGLTTSCPDWMDEAPGSFRTRVGCCASDVAHGFARPIVIVCCGAGAYCCLLACVLPPAADAALCISICGWSKQASKQTIVIPPRVWKWGGRDNSRSASQPFGITILEPSQVLPLCFLSLFFPRRAAIAVRNQGS